MSIHFETYGSGAPLIMIHGLFGTLDNLRSLAKKLSDQYRVYLIDAPAHGQSTTPLPLNLTTMAQTVIQFLDEQKLEKVTLLGHSLGGKIAMEMCLIAPHRINQLIVADIAPVTYPRRHDGIINGLKAVGSEIKHRRDADTVLKQFIPETGIRGFLLKSFVGENGKIWAFDLEALANDYENLIAGNSDKSCAVNTLFIVGGRSNYVGVEHKDAILARFPNTRSKIIQDAGHWLHAEKPTAFEKICRDFLVQG